MIKRSLGQTPYIGGKELWDMLLGASWGEQVKKEEGALEVEGIPRGGEKE